MKPFAPARVGHFAVRDSANVVGNNARWTLENNPRGLYPVRSRWQRLNPVNMPAPRPDAVGLRLDVPPAPKTGLLIPFKNLVSTTSSAPVC
jgi:hypothetical protein